MRTIGLIKKFKLKKNFSSMVPVIIKFVFLVPQSQFVMEEHHFMSICKTGGFGICQHFALPTAGIVSDMPSI
jgi:hypothetical protein